MKKVFKYPVNNEVMELPKDALVLTVQLQGDNLCLWALVDPDAPKQTRYFRVVGTGHEVAANMEYIGTTRQGPFVWHLFEQK